MSYLMDRLKLAIHVLRGRPLIYGVNFRDEVQIMGPVEHMMISDVALRIVAPNGVALTADMLPLTQIEKFKEFFDSFGIKVEESSKVEMGDGGWLAIALHREPPEGMRSLVTVDAPGFAMFAEFYFTAEGDYIGYGIWE